MEHIKLTVENDALHHSNKVGEGIVRSLRAITFLEVEFSSHALI